MTHRTRRAVERPWVCPVQITFKHLVQWKNKNVNRYSKMITRLVLFSSESSVYVFSFPFSSSFLSHVALWLYVSDSWSSWSTTLLQIWNIPETKNCDKHIAEMLYKHSWFPDDEVYWRFLSRPPQVDLDMSDGLPWQLVQRFTAPRDEL